MSTTTLSAAGIALSHSTTMTRRSIRRIARYPSMTVLLVGMPVVFLVLFVFVFGQTLGAGLGFGDAGRSAYAGYITPGILVVTIAAAAQGTAISVAIDMASGLIARFRTMPVTRSAVLTGHAVSSFVQTFGSILLVLLVALLIGFRPTAGLAGWLGALGTLAAFTVALTWLSVALGLWAKTVESASNIPMFLILLPFLSSGFVPTDSLPTALRWFAEYEPFTPVIESVRGLLLGGAALHYVVLALGWSLVITVVSVLWAKRLFERRPQR
jgi:ABC-2 type transport system permease protein